MDFQKLNEQRQVKKLAYLTEFEAAIGRTLTDSERDSYFRGFIDCFDWLLREQEEELIKLLAKLEKDEF